MTGRFEELIAITRNLVLGLQSADRLPSPINAAVREQLRAAVEAAGLELADALAAAYAAESTYSRSAPIAQEIGALKQWWRELEAGVNGQDRERPSTWKTDPLWRAAGYESAGREAARLGLVVSANAYRRQAARTILDAAKHRGRKS
jgi:hypothetical protein